MLLNEQPYLIAESIPHLVWVAGPDGVPQYVNRRWQQYTGLSLEQARAWASGSFIHPADVPTLYERWNTALEAGAYEAVCRLRRADGAFRWHSVRALAMRDGRGNVTHWFGTCTDVEDHKRAEEALARDALLLANVRDSVIVTDLDGAVTYWNEGATRLFGWTAGEMLGRPLTDRVPEEARGKMAATTRAIRDGQDFAGEWEDYRKDGTRVWIDARVSRITDAAGECVGILGVSRDVSDRKRAEAERNDLLARLRLQVERLPLAYLLFDADFRLIDWNPAAERVFGYGKEEVLGMGPPFEKILPPTARRQTDEVLRRLRSGDMAAHNVNENLTKDGRVITCEWFNTPLLDAGGRVTGLLALARDVTERVRLEEQFRQAQKMEGIGRLAGGIAHDFNNLLTVINGYAHMLLQDLGEAAPEATLARDILKAGERAAALTQQLLTFSRKQIVAPRVLDLNAAVADAEAMLRRIIGEDVVLTKDLQPGLGRVRADPAQVQQVVMNLAVNARDAMPRGGRLSIQTRDVLRGEVGPYVLLTVSDTGCGMTEAVKAHLFEPFFTTKGPGAGTGLGLPTVYGIVKQSGGHIEVESQPGVGTTFRIYLPRTEEAPKEEKPDGAGPPPRGSETVLLAEDEDGVRSLIRQVLQAGGYAVLEASDGAQALWLAGRHRGRIDLLITDVVMPGLDGRGLAERLGAARPGLRVLYLSGYTDDAVVRYGVLQEQVHFLQKPFPPAALARKVREVLDLPAAAAANRPDSA